MTSDDVGSGGEVAGGWSVMSPDAIVSDVCTTYSIPLRVLLGRRRDRWLTKARREAALRLYALGMSLSDIGLRLKRDRTTITYLLHGRKR